MITFDTLVEQRRTIVLAEHDPRERLDAVEAVERWGYSAVECGDDKDAVLGALVRAQPPKTLLFLHLKSALALMGDIHDNSTLSGVPCVVVTNHPSRGRCGCGLPTGRRLRMLTQPVGLTVIEREPDRFSWLGVVAFPVNAASLLSWGSRADPRSIRRRWYEGLPGYYNDMVAAVRQLLDHDERTEQSLLLPQVSSAPRLRAAHRLASEGLTEALELVPLAEAAGLVAAESAQTGALTEALELVTLAEAMLLSVLPHGLEYEIGDFRTAT